MLHGDIKKKIEAAEKMKQHYLKQYQTWAKLLRKYQLQALMEENNNERSHQ